MPKQPTHSPVSTGFAGLPAAKAAGKAVFGASSLKGPKGQAGGKAKPLLKVMKVPGKGRAR
jgi:hypothetical protein